MYTFSHGSMIAAIIAILAVIALCVILVALKYESTVDQAYRDGYADAVEDSQQAAQR